LAGLGFGGWLIRAACHGVPQDVRQVIKVAGDKLAGPVEAI
jgi:hypothetical protein